MKNNKRTEEIIAAMEKEINYWRKLAGSYAQTIEKLVEANARRTEAPVFQKKARGEV